MRDGCQGWRCAALVAWEIVVKEVCRGGTGVTPFVTAAVIGMATGRVLWGFEAGGRGGNSYVPWSWCVRGCTWTIDGFGPIVGFHWAETSFKTHFKSRYLSILRLQVQRLLDQCPPPACNLESRSTPPPLKYSRLKWRWEKHQSTNVSTGGTSRQRLLLAASLEPSPYYRNPPILALVRDTKRLWLSPCVG